MSWPEWTSFSHPREDEHIPAFAWSRSSLKLQRFFGLVLHWCRLNKRSAAQVEPAVVILFAPVLSTDHQLAARGPMLARQTIQSGPRLENCEDSKEKISRGQHYQSNWKQQQLRLLTISHHHLWVYLGYDRLTAPVNIDCFHTVVFF